MAVIPLFLMARHFFVKNYFRITGDENGKRLAIFSYLFIFLKSDASQDKYTHMNWSFLATSDANCVNEPPSSLIELKCIGTEPLNAALEKGYDIKIVKNDDYKSALTKNKIDASKLSPEELKQFEKYIPKR